MLDLSHKIRFIFTFTAAAFAFSGCSSDIPAYTFSGDAYSDGYCSIYQDTVIHLNEDGLVNRLDYNSMQDVPLCNKPNCRHTADDCILNRLDGKVPVFAGSAAYYFVDQDPNFVQDEDGKPELQLESSLFCYDFETGKETKLFSLPGVSVSKNCYGLLIHDHILYFITNSLSRYYDENGIMLGYGGTGGEMHLYAYNLSERKEADICRLFEVNQIKEYYPEAPNSAEAYMKGLFDNKIYFNVGFVAGKEKKYRFYVTYYDLKDKTYYGTPEDYGDISFSAVNYVSDDYLVICRDGEASVYKKDSGQPVILEDPFFNQDVFPSVWNNTVFCNDKVYDLNNKATRTLEWMMDKFVVTKYEDYFIISDSSMLYGFEKIPAEKLLN